MRSTRHSTLTKAGAHGLTLLELLISVCILGVLFATILAVIPRAREQGRIATCLSNLSQIGKGMQLYRNDYNDGWPITDTVRLTNKPGGSGYFPLGGGLYPEYVKDRRVFLCLSDPKLLELKGIKLPFVPSSYVYIIGQIVGSPYYPMSPSRRAVAEAKRRKIEEYLAAFGTDAIILEDPHHYHQEPLEHQRVLALLADLRVKSVSYSHFLQQVKIFGE